MPSGRTYKEREESKDGIHVHFFTRILGLQKPLIVNANQWDNRNRRCGREAYSHTSKRVVGWLDGSRRGTNDGYVPG